MLLSVNNIYASCYNSTTKIKNIGDMSKVMHCFQSEINALKQVKSTSQIVEVQMLPKLPKPTIAKTVSTKKAKIDLIGCKKNTPNIICNLIVTPKKDNSDLRFGQDANAFDELGNKIIASSVLYDKTGKERRAVVANVPLKVTIAFENVAEMPTQFVKLSIWISGHRWFSIRGIALQ